MPLSLLCPQLDVSLPIAYRTLKNSHRSFSSSLCCLILSASGPQPRLSVMFPFSPISLFICMFPFLIFLRNFKDTGNTYNQHSLYNYLSTAQNWQFVINSMLFSLPSFIKNRYIYLYIYMILRLDLKSLFFLIPNLLSSCQSNHYHELSNPILKLLCRHRNPR